jgi:DNA-binding CsgD family transcriptional regulator
VPGKTGGVVRAIEDARAAGDGHRWGDAWRLLSREDVDELDIDDLDRLATAAYLTGHDEEGFTHWVRAHQLCARAGEVHRAAYFGVKLAQGLGFKGDLGRCRGWVDRTGRLLENADIDCVEQGYLSYGLGMLRIFEAGDLAGAHALFVQAGKVGGRFADHELVTMARVGEGRMLIYLGELNAGIGLLDEAMVSIEAGELSPMATGDAYCTVIDACAELFDLARCRAWTDSFGRWCDTQQELVLYRGHCFLHRAEILGLLGDWPGALTEARRACDRLAAPVNPAALGAACAIEGDLLRLVGHLDEAEAVYQRASEIGHDPQPGLALVRLAQGGLDAANAMIRRALGEAADPFSRARLLGPYVEIVLAAGDSAAARTAADELRGVAVELGSPFLGAHAARAAGTVLVTEGDAEAALVELRRAFHQFNTLGARHDAARTRLLISEACTALGDHDAAAMEARAGHSVLDALCVGVTARRARTDSPEGLTQRELEVLRLLAQGKTNRAIAGELVVSEKTVASHVSHIFTKLGLTSRSAATAYAYAHDLV